ncbi:hypothetical protein GLOTRDRAFT_113948 [Gloeophyllum trabeum ATCC 11539]|uniref:DLIC-domain-containing protein n=1 Tax=Gloeophyllum trabeum (strain ATCC 11539 / FP-39264 / Madison 617) TaxID=670483 RepID=S7QIN1_GLOTA|nr:uncharacterized protein GLOTRDRAFT_113948 [Gloeophyllum trabeum ATCC 11539]EPQ59183.1 hypothetical protein GLOTRDRAFT_113948 [Gloeophyllum trabeum ATCC 11539]
MEVSRSSTPEAPPQDLWSSILDSVSSTRAIPSKQVLLLGQPSSGKSTLASALLQKSVEAEDGKEELRSDFALGYDWADIRDDADEDTLARLSVYTVPSAATSYTALLPHFLPSRTSLPHTLVMIALDWTKPWTFVEELETWLCWVEKWAKGDGSRELEITREENRERLQFLLQHYAEPSADPLPPTTNLSNTILPLGPGTLTHNSAGVPIIVTCTKADLIDDNSELGGGASGMGVMVKGKGGEWEERTDGVMQVLRTICLKYGAALFYTTPLPATLQVLRQYTLHMLFTPPAPSPGMSTGTEAPAPIRNPFPFQHKPNALDRDRIIVPAGWDSWGKIAVLREGFDAKLWGEAWENDIETAEGGMPEDPSAQKLYRTLVPDNSTKPPPLPPLNMPTPEQVFLAKHYDENAKKPDRDPRGAFRNPAEASTAAGIVGPLGSSSFNLPNVERALTDMETGSGAVATQAGGEVPRKISRASSRPTATLATGGTGAPHGLGRSTSGSPANVGSPSPTGQTQHEVLQNFFQSLLSSKDRPGAAAAASRTSTAKPANGTSPGAETEEPAPQ